MNDIINNLLIKGKNILREAGIESYSLDAQVLLSNVLNLTKIQLITTKSDVSQHLVEKYINQINERAKNKPIAYIVGEKEFMSLDFMVNEDVLIPRPDTEILVETVLKFSSKFSFIIDIGTGSGCIPISLCHYNKNLFSLGIDISPRAIKVAKQNANKNNVANQTAFFTGDLFLPLPVSLKGYVDAIVSNPPYIPESEMDSLAPNVLNYEPHNALFAKDNGLYFYKKITEKSKEYLTQYGMIFYEIAYNQADLVVKILEQNHFKNIEVIQDLSGNNRVVFGTIVS